MVNSFSFTSFIALLCCILAGVFCAWLLYGSVRTKADFFKNPLALCRAISIALILWLLFSPLIRQNTYLLEKPIVVIAQDNSQSIAGSNPSGFDSVKYKKDLLQLQEELAEKYDVRTYSFSDHISKTLDFDYTGKLTNAVLLIAQLKDELMNRNVGAVIIATDGIFNRGGNPAADLEGLKAPVYSIALGDTVAQKDVLITNVTNNALAYLDNTFSIEVQVEAYQTAGNETMLSISENGKKLQEQVIRINSNQFSKTIILRIKADKLGAHQYTLNLSPVKGEVFLKNNSQHLSVEVIDDRQKILIAAAGPHPDISAIKTAIAENKRYDVSVRSGEQLSGIDPSGYGLIILHQLPDQSSTASSFLDKVRNAEVPLWFIIGAQSNLGKFNEFQNQVNIDPNDKNLVYTNSDLNTGTSVFDLDLSAAKAIGNFDPLQATAGQVKISGDGQVVLYQRKGMLKTNIPQLFFMNTTGRKTGYLIGEGVWKWRLSEAKLTEGAPVFNALMSKIAQYLSVKTDKKKFAVYPAKTVFDENEHILLNANLYNDSYIPVNTPDVNIQLADDKGKQYNFSFSKTESAYRLDAGILPPGSYSYIASTTLGPKKYTAKGSFFSNALIAEYQQTVANHQLLYQLSSQTNGKMFLPDQLTALKEEITKSEQMKTLSYENRRYEELVNFKWLFVLILGLLSIEWFFRKRNGEV